MYMLPEESLKFIKKSLKRVNVPKLDSMLPNTEYCTCHSDRYT